MKEQEIRERLEEIRRKMNIMEWDKSMNQFNPGKEGLYSGLKEEKIKLETQLSNFASSAENQTESEEKTENILELN